MEEIREIAVAIGCTAVICGIVSAVSPKDKYRKITDIITGLFAILVIAGFLVSASKAFSGGKIGSEAEKTMDDARASYNSQLASVSAESIERIITERLEECGITSQHTEVRIMLDGDTVKVEKAEIYVKSSDTDAAREACAELELPIEIISSGSGGEEES